jgi:hypothetical protein
LALEKTLEMTLVSPARLSAIHEDFAADARFCRAEADKMTVR